MRYAPLFFIIGFLAFAFFLTVFGPVKYYEFDATRVMLYLGAICLSISIGYVIGVRVPMARPYSSAAIARTLYDRRLFNFMAALAFTGFIFTLITSLFFKGISFDPTSIGKTYTQGYKNYVKDSGTYSLTFIMSSLMAAPSFLVTIWGLYYFKTFRIWTQAVILLVAIGLPVILTLSLGTQERTGYLMVFVSAMFLLKATSRGTVIKPRTIAIVVTIAIAGIAAMTTILSQRYASIAINALNINKNDLAVIHFDINHPLFRLVGPDLGFILSELCEYLTNGIVGLSYALHTPFTWSFMFGASYPISVIGERLFGLPFAYLHTYPYLAAMESGWGEQRWYTIFSWFASDFTFFGTIPLFGFFAFAYARCWLEGIRFENPFAILLFCELSLGVVMMTANNQLMASPGSLATLGVVVFLYVRYRRRYNRRLVVA